MKKLFVLLFFIMVGFFSKAQLSVSSESQFYASKNQNYSFVSLYSAYMLSDNIGIWNYSQISKDGWGEIILGPVISLKTNLAEIELGVGAGFERFCPKIRMSTFLGATFGENYFYSNLEFLGSGHWYVAYFKRSLSEKISLGASIQSDATIGPRIDLTLGDFTLWSVPGYYLPTKQAGIQLGLSINLY